MTARNTLRWLAIGSALITGIALLALGLTGTPIPSGLATLFGTVMLGNAIARATEVPA